MSGVFLEDSSGCDSSCAGSRRPGRRGPGARWEQRRALLVPPLGEPAIARRSAPGSAVPAPGVPWGLPRENAAAASPRREAEEERRAAGSGLAFCTPLRVAVRSSPGCYLPGE